MGDNKIKRVAVSGASGFVGFHLGEYLRGQGMEVTALSRGHFTDEGRAELHGIVARCDAVVNLAGAPINRRWTEKHKAELYDSRINTTRRLVDAIAAAGGAGPKVFLSTSAVGFYSNEGCNSEYEYEEGEGFLARLCRAWEQEAARAEPYVRTVVMRFGLVLSPEGGALKPMAFPTRFGLAAMFGSGRQPFPWIDIDDVTGAAGFILNDESLSGAFNFTAPQVIDNREFTAALASRTRSRLRVKIPGALFKAVLGEASSFVLEGQCVVPEKLLRAGYPFRSPDIRTFLHRYR